VILCTGYSHSLDEAGAAARGISAFVMKPMVMAAIDATIRKVLAERGSRALAAERVERAA
jgi:response regulator RpfG family c-di-GMP phosphodiesterase